MNRTRDAARFDRAVAPQQGESLEAPLLFLDVEPWPHQREMLEKLAVERERHHRFKNLVVAATGTGKTIVAALDYKAPARSARRSRALLFVAHRQEILKQSLGAFRQVLRSGRFRRSSTWTATGPTSGGTCLRPFSRSHRSIWSSSIRPRSTS